MNQFSETRKIPKGTKPHIKLFIIPRYNGFIVTDSFGNAYLKLQPSLEMVYKKTVEEIESRGVEVRLFLHILQE